MPDLIVMRLANMHRVHPRQDNTRVCGLCNEQVGIYPSGQRALREYEGLRIVCDECRDQSAFMLLAPGAREERTESVPAKKGKP
jgi:hypothetical protein